MRRRTGFTLVELLVAVALVLFIMSILSHAFVAATQSFRGFKAAGDLAERLRSVTGQLRRDLAADHFEGGKRLSDPTFWSAGPPTSGFFRVSQGSRPVPAGRPGLCVLEGTDADGLQSYRTADHALHFTARLRGNGITDFFAGGVPAASPLLTGIFGPVQARYQEGTAFRYQWAEVAYFLRPTTGTANGTPLYALYRRQRLAVLENAQVPPQPSAAAAQYLEVSCGDPTGSGSLSFNNPLDLTVPERRFGGGGPNYPILAEQTGDPNLRGADLALSDVVSFDVRLLLVPQAQGYRGPTDPRNPFVDLYDPRLDVFDNGNAARFAANGPRVFDTWSRAASTVAALDYSTWGTPGTAKSVPMWIPPARKPNLSNDLRGPLVRAVQITIRVWDLKTSTTRQVTIAQAL